MGRRQHTASIERISWYVLRFTCNYCSYSQNLSTIGGPHITLMWYCPSCRWSYELCSATMRTPNRPKPPRK